MGKIVLKKKSETDLENLSTMPDTTIDMTDNPELDASFFENAEFHLLPLSTPMVRFHIKREITAYGTD
jgi:hypothetical protein